tara:strand:+ start:35496 stop:35918 length:423 start_codon:yes stop_codon:yes gene_type:complete
MTSYQLNISINGENYEIAVTNIRPDFIQISINNTLYDLPLIPSQEVHTDLSEPRDNSRNHPILGPNDKTSVIHAQMSGKVIAICVEPGQSVSVGELLCTIEAMKMEQNIISPVDGIIESIHIQPMEAVLSNQPLMSFRQS